MIIDGLNPILVSFLLLPIALFVRNAGSALGLFLCFSTRFVVVL